MEATVLGNLLVQARTAGELGTLAELREIVAASSAPAMFEPRDTARWSETYPRFVELVARSARDAAV